MCQWTWHAGRLECIQSFVYLDPAAAELLGGVAAEAADVSADHGDAEEAEAEHGVDGVPEVVPGGGVVAGPVRGVPAGPHERGPAEDEGAAAGVGEQRAVRGARLQEAVEVVRVVLAHAAVVHRGRRRGLVVDGAAHAGVVDAVRRVVQRVERRRVDEVGDLVHVDPQAVDGEERPPEQRDLARPELGGARVEEVREVDVPRPHLAQVVGAVPLQEHVLLHPSDERPVRLVHVDPCMGVSNGSKAHRSPCRECSKGTAISDWRSSLIPGSMMTTYFWPFR